MSTVNRRGLICIAGGGVLTTVAGCSGSGDAESDMQEVNETTESDESEGDSESEPEEDESPQDETSSVDDESQEEADDEPDSEANETGPDGDEEPLFTLPDTAEGKLERGDRNMEMKNETDGCTITAELENIGDETYTVDAVIGAYTGDEMRAEGWVYNAKVAPEETAILEANLGNCADTNRYKVEVTRVD